MKTPLLMAASILIPLAAGARAQENPAGEPVIRAADIRVMKLILESPDLLRAAGLECRDPKAELDMRHGAILGRPVAVGYRSGVVSLIHLRHVPEAQVAGLKQDLTREFGAPAYDRAGCSGWTKVKIGQRELTIEILNDPQGGKAVAVF